MPLLGSASKLETLQRFIDHTGNCKGWFGYDLKSNFRLNFLNTGRPCQKLHNHLLHDTIRVSNKCHLPKYAFYSLVAAAEP